MSTIETPQPTEFATPPSPTKIDSNLQMPVLSPITKPLELSKHKPLYLIVATALSPLLGIGNKGDLPWPQIRTDMAFFRKVTSNTTNKDASAFHARNAVIMGRKTWDSIPAKFRPLGGRINVILTRGDEAACLSLAQRVRDELQKKAKSSGPAEKVHEDNFIVRPSRLNHQSHHAPAVRDDFLVHIQSAENTIGDVIITNSIHAAADVNSYASTTDLENGQKLGINEMFCIGGAEIYGMTLRDEHLRKRVRVLQTLVRRLDDDPFDCDTFWPEIMEDGVNGWRKAEDEEVKGWIRTDLPQGEAKWVNDDKARVEIRVVGWART